MIQNHVFLKWNAKTDILKNVHAAVFYKTNSDIFKHYEIVFVLLNYAPFYKM